MAASRVSIEELVVALEQEFEQLRNDAAERAQEAGRGAALIGTAGALGLVSVGALGSLPLLALRRVLPAWQIALIVAGGTAAGAVTLARLGAARLAAIAPEALTQEVEEAEKDVAGALR
ncbi:MAG TPA: phage holin family protein [Gaiellaceae bacterium]|nr:phage holin family protein [Gaiellaceae bacterium]